MVADVGDLRNLDASEIYVRRLSAKEVLTPKNGEKLRFPFADESVKLAGRDQVFLTSTLMLDHLAQGAQRSSSNGKGQVSTIRPSNE